MRQQAGFRQHETGHFGKVGNGRFMAQRGQFVSRGTVTKLRFVAQRKKRLGTPGCRPPPRDGKHVVGCQVNGLSAPRRMRKGAVMADIPAQFCQRDKYLRAVGHKIAVAVITQARGSRHQIVELRVENIGRHGCCNKAECPGQVFFDHLVDDPIRLPSTTWQMLRTTLLQAHKTAILSRRQDTWKN